MRHSLRLALALPVLLAPIAPLVAQPAADEQPALVLMVVVDQMRYDYLERFSEVFDSGLRRLLDEGAVFTNANYEAAPTVTAVGHATVLTGAPPMLSGIAGNAWYDRGEQRSIQSITDSEVDLLGGDRGAAQQRSIQSSTDGEVEPLGGGSAVAQQGSIQSSTNVEVPPLGASPKRLMVTTVGDELKASGRGGKVFGVSLKDRSAILPAGRAADGAFWFDAVSGNFVSSSWYFDALPAWANEFNAARAVDRYAGRDWDSVALPSAGSELYRSLDDTPFADELVLDFALRLMEEEDLGKDALTDLLSVSFSAMDYLGHRAGPDTPLMPQFIAALDDTLGRLIEAAEAQAGAGKVLLVLTADHGVAPVPEENAAKRLPGGRYDARAERAAVEEALVAAFGEGKYIAGTGEMSYYFHPQPVPDKNIPRAELERVAAEALRRQPNVYRVYTRSDLENANVGGDLIDRRVRMGFNPLHSGDVLVVHDPHWLAGFGGPGGGTTHGSPFSYDTHVPLIFWGAEALVQPGVYHGEAAVHDIAATLSGMLGIARPSGSMGRVLAEMLPE